MKNFLKFKLAGTAIAAVACAAFSTQALADFVIIDDLIVDGSACIGFDCVNGESFGFDTIRLKENNLRIKFDDTSVAASFPRNDWQITVNDSANGGLSKFSIDDISGSRTPFTIEAGARSHSLYVDDGGRIGIRTSTPSTELHIVDGDTPTLRLQQDGSSGFAPQTWDVAGNETNFFVRDVTNGSQLPFRIRPDAPTSSIFIDTNGEVGMGNSAPDGALHITRSADTYVTLENTTAGRKWYFTHENNAPNRFIISRDDAGAQGLFLSADGSFQVGGNGTAGNGLSMDASGNVAIGGTLTENSDRNTKTGIINIDDDEILLKLAALDISEWSYKHEADVRHIGPMAQDFYALFGTGTSEKRIATLDTSGVALASVKAVYMRLQEREARLAQLEQQIARLEGELRTLAE